MVERKSTIKRTTRETSIGMEINLDGTGEWEISTGILMLDHLLAQIAKHGLFNIKCSASGNDHHY